MSILRRFLPFLLIVLLACDSDDDVPTDAIEIVDKGVGLFEKGNYRQAEILFLQSLSQFEQRSASANVAVVAGYLGRIGLAQGEFRNAIEQIENGIRHTKKANHFREEMRLQTLLGDVYAHMGEYDEARKQYRAVNALAVAFNDSETKAEMNYNLALTALQEAEVGAALESCEAALNFYRTRNSPEQVAKSLLLLGSIHASQERYAEALNILNQAETASAQLTDGLLNARVHLSLGQVFRAQGNAPTALRHFREGTNRLRAKRLAREYETVFLFEIGNIYFQTGQYENAKKFYTDASAVARALGDRISENYLYFFIIQCNEQLGRAAENPANAERLATSYRQLAARFAETLNRTGEAAAYMRAGMLYERHALYTTAREMYLKAVLATEERHGEYRSYEFHTPFYREAGFNPTGAYRRLAGALLQVRSPSEALAILDRGTTMSFYDVFRRSDVAVRLPLLKDDVEKGRIILTDLRRQEVELSNALGHRQRATNAQRIKDLRTETGRMRAEFSKIATRVGSLHSNYEPLVRPGPTKLGELQAFIPRGTLLLHFLPTESQLHVFALSRSRFEVKTSAVSGAQLAALVAEYKSLLHDPRAYAGSAGEESVPVMTRFAKLSTELYNFLIRPVDGLVERNLVIVADQPFDGFPFHALERQDQSGVKYLIELTNVDYLPSLSSLKYKTSSSLRIRDVIAVGNPTGKNWSIDYELRDVRSFFKEATILTGLEASWEQLRRLRGDVLQLATDFVREENDRPWGVMMLSDGQTLEKSSVVRFEMLAEMNAFPLVYLSNQSGTSSGLSRYHAMLLRMNGTADVFLNAWYADRKSAKFFSEFFFTYLANGLAPGDAYRQALLNLIKTREVNHPRSWGQFFHYGVG